MWMCADELDGVQGSRSVPAAADFNYGLCGRAGGRTAHCKSPSRERRGGGQPRRARVTYCLYTVSSSRSAYITEYTRDAVPSSSQMPDRTHFALRRFAPSLIASCKSKLHVGAFRRWWVHLDKFFLRNSQYYIWRLRFGISLGTLHSDHKWKL